MKLHGWASLLAILTAVGVFIGDIQGLIPDKYAHYVMITATVIAGVTKAVRIIQAVDKLELEQTPTKGEHNA